MPAWVHDRAKHLMPEMQKQYGKKKGKQVAFATATQMSHRLRKTPKGFGTAAGKREAKAKFDKPLREYKKTAGDIMTEEILKQAMWDAYVDEFWKLAGMPASGAKPPIGGAATIKPPTTQAWPSKPAPAAPIIGAHKPGAPTLGNASSKPSWASGVKPAGGFTAGKRV